MKTFWYLALVTAHHQKEYRQVSARWKPCFIMFYFFFDSPGNFKLITNPYLCYFFLKKYHWNTKLIRIFFSVWRTKNNDVLFISIGLLAGALKGKKPVDKLDCADSNYGCCLDGHSFASGPKLKGCLIKSKTSQ